MEKMIRSKHSAKPPGCQLDPRTICELDPVSVVGDFASKYLYTGRVGVLPLRLQLNTQWLQ